MLWYFLLFFCIWAGSGLLAYAIINHRLTASWIDGDPLTQDDISVVMMMGCLVLVLVIVAVIMDEVEAWTSKEIQ